MEATKPLYTWEEQQRVIKDILGMGGMQSFVDTLPRWNDAFKPVEKPCVCCMDEGIAIPGSYRAAGSMLGWPLEDVNNFCEKAGVYAITSHESCAASGAVYKKHLAELGLDPENGYTQEGAEEFTVSRTKDMVKALNETFGNEDGSDKFTYGGHIPLSEMDRPKDRHIASLIVINASTYAFSPGLADGLPPAFVIDRAPATREEMLAQVTIAVSVACGDHGWGDKVKADETSDSKLMVVVIGDPSNDHMSSARIAEELQELDGIFGGRVIIEQCTAPLPEQFVH
jgi:hypothetical protein